MTIFEKLEELIYKGFKETDERLAKQRQETDERIEKERRENEARIEKERRESEARIGKERQEAEKRWQETDALIAKERQETERLWRETDQRMERSHQKTQRELDRIAEQLDGVSNSLSRFSEQAVLPATKRIFKEHGVRLNLFYSNMEIHDIGGENMETDIIGLGPKCVVLIEVKLRLRKSDVNKFLEKKLPRFFEFFPNFRQPILYGGVAGMSIDDGVDRFAYKKGLFVIAQTGDNLKILNDKKFRPRSFAEKEDNRFTKRKVS